METLLVDGQWNLKKNFYKRRSLVANGKQCGGVFGFLDSLKSVMNKVLPDRVIVMWDGFNAGKLRYEIYKPYKANRKKDWEAEERIITTEGIENSDDADEFELLQQKIVLKNYLEELFVRQVEVDLIEADDLIALYILYSTNENENFTIYSRDKDYLQLVSEKVSILTPDKFTLVNIDNFKEHYGYTHENVLLFKCFDGDNSDDIGGVNGVTTNNLLKNFPAMANEKYTYKRLVEECYNKKREKKLKLYDKIIDSHHVLYRNAKLMNLRQPFYNEEAKQEINNVLYKKLDSNRSIETAIKMFVDDGFSTFIDDSYFSLFFAPFYNLMTKEKQQKI